MNRLGTTNSPINQGLSLQRLGGVLLGGSPTSLHAESRATHPSAFCIRANLFVCPESRGWKPPRTVLTTPAESPPLHW